MNGLEMDPVIRARWVAALRSGEYPQGHGALRVGDGNFCCLGVLCELAVKDGVISPPVETNGYWQYSGESGTLPLPVADWAKVGGNQVPPSGDGLAVAEMNDGNADRAPWPFAQIADAIEGAE